MCHVLSLLFFNSVQSQLLQILMRLHLIINKNLTIFNSKALIEKIFLNLEISLSFQTMRNSNNTHF